MIDNYFLILLKTKIEKEICMLEVEDYNLQTHHGYIINKIEILKKQMVIIHNPHRLSILKKL